ncbi:MAG: tripartite tricarboxylate transporter permease [Eubacteriales bacterium]
MILYNLQSIFIALIIANVFMLLLQGLLAKYFAQVITIPKYILFPIIICFCVIGTYIVNISMFNVYLMLVIAVFALFLSQNGIPLTPIVMGFTLGSIIEENYRKAIIYYGTFTDAFNSWSIGTWLVILSILIPIIIVVKRTIDLKKAN